MVRFQTTPKAGIKFMVGESASPTNPEKGRSGKLKENYSDCLRDTSNGDLKYTSEWIQMNPG